MKASMKKSLVTLQASITAQAAQVHELLQAEESYACDLEDDTKIEESESRQELLSELEDSLGVSGALLDDLLA